MGAVEQKKEHGEDIEAFVEVQDVFTAFPTGYGKSYCYRLLPLVCIDHLRSKPASSIVVTTRWVCTQETVGCSETLRSTVTCNKVVQ